MSVSRSGDGRELSYENIEVQNLRNQYQIDAGDMSSADTRVSVEGAYTFEPLGGLGRHEVAELIAITGTTFAFHHVGGSDPGWADHEFELSMDGKAKTIINLSDDTTIRTELDGTVVDDKTTIDVVDHDVLLYSQPHNTVSWEDTTNGLGGGGSAHMHHFEKNFRDMFDQGPMLDRHSTLFQHISVGNHNKTSGSPIMYVNLQFYWLVHETDRA